MKKILTFFIACFISAVPMSSSAADSSNDGASVNDEAKTELIFLHNEYIIQQLKTLSRAVKKQPHRMGAKLDEVALPLLEIKLASLNNMLKNEVTSGKKFLFQPFNEGIEITIDSLFLQSQQMLKLLPKLFHKYQLPPLLPYDKGASLGSFSRTVTYERLYQQFIQIESFLFGLKSVIEPKGVLVIMRAIRSTLEISCGNQVISTSAPLIMGKRPKDVYVRLFNYLTQLSKYTQFPEPSNGPVRILPQDVFDVAIIALVYSRELLTDEEKVLFGEDVRRFDGLPEIITPSHVYQAVSENIELLECVSHANS